MSERTVYSEWQSRQREVHAAEEWNNLPNGPRYQNDSFRIMPTHSSIKLTRGGQQSCGGKNYWESPDALNKALLAVIVKNSKQIIAEAIDLMRAEEQAALLGCKEWISGMQDEISQIENGAAKPEFAIVD